MKKPRSKIHAKASVDRQTEAKVAATPTRKTPHYYRGARPGTSIEEVSGKRTFHTDNDFVDDLDDRDQILEKLTEAGVDRAYEEHDSRSRKHQDREFELKQEAFGSNERELPEEDLDLDQLPKVSPLKADKTLS